MITESQIAQYHRDGYTMCPEFLTRDEVEIFLNKIDSICAGQTLADHDPTRLEMEPEQSAECTAVRRIYDPCIHYPVFRQFAVCDKLMDCAEKLIGPDIIFNASKVNMKPPSIGSVVRWHQDFAYGPLTNTDVLTVLFYLDDTNQLNGCLQVLPGRHHGPLFDHSRDGYFQGEITEAIDTSDAVAMEAKAGAAIFLHAMTPHSSTTNRSLRSRRTLILMYRAADAFPIYCGPMTLESIPNDRLVRGKLRQEARITLDRVTIPNFRQGIASLYQLQEGNAEA